MKPIIICIAGGSGSGKTTLADKIKEQYINQVLIIKLDDYYKDQSHLSFDEREKTNYDHPDAFDYDLFSKQIIMLKNNEPIKKPIYDFPCHNRSNKTEEIEAKRIIIIEGIYVLADERIRNLADILIYVDTDADVRFIRRLKRDMKERGRTMDSVINQYLSTVKPMHDQFIEPSKKYAHIIIPEGYNDVALDLLMSKIKSIL